MTSEPNHEYTLAISNPITPAPITINFSGIFFKLNASVDDINTF